MFKKVYDEPTETISLSNIISVIAPMDKKNTFILMDNNDIQFEFRTDDTTYLEINLWINIIKAYINAIPVCIMLKCPRIIEYSCNFGLLIPYYEPYQYELSDLIIDILNTLKQKYKNVKFKVTQFESDSFTDRMTINLNQQNKYFTNITNYSKELIIKKGIHGIIDIELFEHNIMSNNITCEYMLEYNQHNIVPFTCPIYAKMIYKEEYNDNNLQHMMNYNHFKNEHKEIPKCENYYDCNAQKRLEYGETKLEDRCHVKLYRHPPRNCKTKTDQYLIPFSFNEGWSDIKELYKPSIDDNKEYEINEGYLEHLIAEVIKNGYEDDLYLEDEDEEEEDELYLGDDDEFELYPIMDIVKEKLQCNRHKLMGSPLNKAEMLAVILYTDSDINYDLSKQQCNADYSKWKWFDYCLFNAIYKLSQREYGSYKVYTGLHDVELNDNERKCGYFKTYLSTSWSRDVALAFIHDNGVLFEIDETFRENAICCDVSWISKFENEREVLFARSIDAVLNDFECKVVGQDEDLQYVVLSEFGSFEHSEKNENMDKQAKKLCFDTDPIIYTMGELLLEWGQTFKTSKIEELTGKLEGQLNKLRSKSIEIYEDENEEEVDYENEWIEIQDQTDGHKHRSSYDEKDISKIQ